MVLRRLLLSLVGILAVLATLWFTRVAILREAAALWIVSDPVRPADAVAVFGGGLEDRPFAAAAYYRQGLVKRILISNVHESPSERLGVEPTHVDANRAVLLKLGVPESAIEIFGTGLQTTQQEALALRQWAARTGAHSLIVPTEIFSARRLHWTLHHVFGDEVAICVPAIDPPEYDRSNWWRDEGGVIGFQNELIKYIYYRLRY